MKKYDNLHRFQMIILNKLIFRPTARFSDLKIPGLSTDHLAYHVNELLKAKLAQKDRAGSYTLTDAGKEFSNRIDNETARMEVQGKRGVVLRSMKLERGKKMFLVNRRIKQPFYGYVGFHTGKVRYGETVYQTAIREMKEETGMNAKFYLMDIIHYIDYKPSGELLRDIYFYGMGGYDLSGKLIKNNEKEGVINFWATIPELREYKTYPGFWDRMSYWTKARKPNLNKFPKVPFDEQVRVIEEF